MAYVGLKQDEVVLILIQPQLIHDRYYMSLCSFYLAGLPYPVFHITISHLTRINDIAVTPVYPGI